MIIKKIRNFLGLGGGVELTTLCDAVHFWPAASWKLYLACWILNGAVRIGRKRKLKK
jgi:hypothetical protein